MLEIKVYYIYMGAGYSVSSSDSTSSNVAAIKAAVAKASVPAPRAQTQSELDAESAERVRQQSIPAVSNPPTVPVVPIHKQKINYDPSGVIKSQYNSLKTKLYDISVQENNNLKMARWNTYYYKKYKMESNVFIFIIIVCIVINILTFLHKTYPYFDEGAYMIIVGSILAITILLVFYVYLIIYNKDNMNFDENDYGTDDMSNIRDMPKHTGYVDVDMTDPSNCTLENRDPKNVANSNFLKQLF